VHVAINNAVNNETDQLSVAIFDESKWNDLGNYDISSAIRHTSKQKQNTMSKHVLEFEPHKALFVPDEDALLFYNQLLMTFGVMSGIW
jgi:release factor glutamine methyltransferase